MPKKYFIKSKPKFTIWDIEGVVSRTTFLKAKKLFMEDKVKNFREVRGGYRATVEGSKNYEVFVAAKDILVGDCDCYAGQNGHICKHALAVGLTVLHSLGESMEKDVSPTDLKEVKKMVTKGMRKIKACPDSTKQWYSYSYGLEVGAEIIVEAIQNLPANRTNIKYLWGLVRRLSEKLAIGGVDDSDHGAVGWCVDKLVEKIIKMVREDKKIFDLAKEFSTQETGFGFEEPLKNALAEISQK